MLGKFWESFAAYCLGVTNVGATVTERVSDFAPDWAILLGFMVILAAMKFWLPLWVFKAVFILAIAPSFAGMFILVATAWMLSRKR